MTQMCHVLQSHRERQQPPPSRRCLSWSELGYADGWSVFRTLLFLPCVLQTCDCTTAASLKITSFARRAGETHRRPGCSTVLKMFVSFHLLEAPFKTFPLASYYTTYLKHKSSLCYSWILQNDKKYVTDGLWFTMHARMHFYLKSCWSSEEAELHKFFFFLPSFAFDPYRHPSSSFRDVSKSIIKD